MECKWTLSKVYDLILIQMGCRMAGRAKINLLPRRMRMRWRRTHKDNNRHGQNQREDFRRHKLHSLRSRTVSRWRTLYHTLADSGFIQSHCLPL